MTYLRDETEETLDRTHGPERVWAGVIASNAVDYADRVSVTISGLDGGYLRWEDVRWQPGIPGKLPVRGDECVVVLDDNNELWIPVWGNNEPKPSVVEAVRLVGAGGQPPFENSFLNYGNGYEAAGFYKDPFNRVHLRGLVARATNAANLTIFSLPSGYIPNNILLFHTREADGISSELQGRIDIWTNGEVRHVTGNNGWISLSGISFRVP